MEVTVAQYKVSALLIAGTVIVSLMISCSYDPWTAGKSQTDVVTITKTTKRLGANTNKPVLRSQVGSVKMSHKTHSEKVGRQCVDCHHKKGNDSREKRCAVCHFGDNGYEIMHGLCVDCHVGRNKGPVKCKECH